MACLFCGGSLRYFFCGGSLGFFLVLTIIYLLTIRSQGVSDLKVIEASPLPPSVFGCSIDQTKALEVFVKEVKDYRRAVSDLQELSRVLHQDPATLVNTNSEYDHDVLDGSVMFGNLTDEDIDYVTTGGILHIKSIDDKKYRTRYCWVMQTAPTCPCCCSCCGSKVLVLILVLSFFRFIFCLCLFYTGT